MVGQQLYVIFFHPFSELRAVPEVIAAAQIIYSVLILCFVSSKDELDVVGVTISPSVEVLRPALSTQR